MAKKAAKAAKKPAVAAKKAATKAASSKPKKAAAPKKAATKAEAPKAAKKAAEAPEMKAKAPKVVATDVKPKTKKSEEPKLKLDRSTMTEEERKWADLFEKHKAEKPQTYDMRGTFEAGKPLQHKILGWGWIVSNDNDRLEVLFKDGKRILISNYNR